MATLLWILAVILVVAGIFAIIRSQLHLGHRAHHRRPAGRPGGVSIFT
jgi:hypothetical protein